MKKRLNIKIAVFLSVLCCLTACSEGDTQTTGSLRVSAFAYEGPVVSRAYTDFTGTFGATPANPLVMPFWAVLNSGYYQASESKYNGTSWSTSCRLEPGTYDFYSYLPKSVEEEGVDVVFENTTPATITFKSVPSVMDKDLLLAVATPSGDAGTGDAGTDPSVNPYDQKIFNSDGQIVTFRMDHVLSKLSFSFSNPTGKAFTDLRQVVIKEVQISPTMWPETWDITCTMHKDQAVTYASTDLSWPSYSFYMTNTTELLMGGTPVQGYLVQQKDYGETADVAFGSCYIVPNHLFSDASYVAIRAIYDVYDKDGKLIRSDEQVVNNHLNITPKSDELLAPGKEYKIDVKIIPDYLFVLGDDDAGNSLQIVES